MNILDGWLSGRNDEFYLYANSFATREFPDNKSYAFSVTLPTNLRLNEGQWTVALYDITWMSTKKASRYLIRMHVECDVVEPLIFNSNYRQVIASVPMTVNTARRMHYEPVVKRYVYIQTGTIVDTLSFVVTDDDGDKVTALGRLLSLTLHFRRTSK